jgi:hypothetical protein
MRAILVLVAAAAMFLSAVAHGVFGLAAIRGELAGTGAGEHLVHAISAGWLFGSASMATFGAVVFASGLRLRRGDRTGVLPIRLIAACYVAFGLAALLASHFNPHFLLFVATGLLAGLPVTGAGSARGARGPA